MTGTFFLPEPLVLILIIVIALIIVAAVTYYFFRRPKKIREPGRMITSLDKRVSPYSYQPAAQPIPPSRTRNGIPDGQDDLLPSPKEINLIEGRADVNASLCALVEKYSIEEFTLATVDGLMFASSGGDSAQTDAARYGELFIHDPLSETPGVMLFGISHKGSDLVGIIRTNLQVPDETMEMIENDTKDILNRWI